MQLPLRAFQLEWNFDTAFLEKKKRKERKKKLCVYVPLGISPYLLELTDAIRDTLVYF